MCGLLPPRTRDHAAAIDLDDQSRCVADEVGNEPADRRLSAKSIAFGLRRPQHPPEPLFGFGHVTAEVPGALTRTGAWRFLHHGSVLGITPAPTLPHQGKGVPRKIGGLSSREIYLPEPLFLTLSRRRPGGEGGVRGAR